MLAETALRGGMRRYVDLLGAPRVGRVVLASLLARLPLGMVPLAIILALRGAGDSYAAAGVAVAAYALGDAVTAPVIGQAIDRLGRRRLLVPLSLAVTALLLALALAADGRASLAPLIVLAALTGLAMPPIGPAMRSLWPALLASDELQHTAYAFEATAQEVSFVAGPLVTALLASAISPAAALICAAALAGGGGVAFALLSAKRGERRPRPRGSAPVRAAGGSLTSAGVRTILLSMLLWGAAFGAVEVALPAFGEQHGSRTAGAAAVAAFALGSLLGGLWWGTLRSRRRMAGRYLLALAAFALTLLAPLAAGSLGAIVVLVLIAGIPIAPGFAASYALLGELAPAGTATETFAWVTTTVVLGASLGNALGGTLIHDVSVEASLGLAAGCGALALAAAFARRATLR